MALPRPQGKQKEVVALPPSGHIVILGTAGSGKTTMAIHRAAFLGNERTAHGGPTLLVTFNRTLVAYLEHLRPPELGNVEVRTYHQFARGYLLARGLMPEGAICTPAVRKRLITEAIREVRSRRDHDAILDRNIDFFCSEIKWINQHGIESETQYVQAERIGRAEARLTRQQRPVMHEVYRAYVNKRVGKGLLYDWDDLAMAVRRELSKDSDARRYRHVVVDEAQDLSPEMIRSLARAIPDDGSLSLFADVAQQIYGRRISRSDAGLRIVTPWRFERNYRNSPQLAKLGLAIANMPYYSGQPDMVEPKEFAAEGPLPVIVRLLVVVDAEEALAVRSRVQGMGLLVSEVERVDGRQRFHCTDLDGNPVEVREVNGGLSWRPNQRGAD
jgi:superfamily I DNA/RNA helicase